MADFTFRPVDRSTWSDFESFFESRGAPHYCWCMEWRKLPQSRDKTPKAEKKRCFKRCVDDGIPVGIMAYDEDEPVAWCSVAPRESHRKLGGDETLENVWSITCFFVRKDFRMGGMTKLLISQAEMYARENGAEFIEAYPASKDSPSYKFMGIKDTFEKMGYTFHHMAGKRRHVMVKPLKN